MVIGIAGNATTRHILEDRFAADLRAQGIGAEPSYARVGDGDLDSTRLGAEVHRTGCDGVLVTRIVDQTTAQADSAPTPANLGAPRAYQRGWYNYYLLGSSDLGTPRYGHESQLVHFEANLYRVSDGQLVWSALSQRWLGQLQMPGPGVAHFVRPLVLALRDSRIVATQR